MELNFHERLGRLVVAWHELDNKAENTGMYIGGALTKGCEFYLTVYDSKIDERFYSTPFRKPMEDPGDIDKCLADIEFVGAFIDDFEAGLTWRAKQAQKAAAEQAAKDAEDADRKAAEFIGSFNGEAIENEQEF